jgi:cell division protein FtsA
MDQTVQVGIENGHSASYKDLCNIIRARMEELLQLILLEMPTSDYRTLAPCGLVLTGGTSNLSGLDELGESLLRIPVRNGRPLSTGIYGISDILNDPAYATTLGLILWQVRGKEGSTFREKRTGTWSSFMSLIRKLFRA